MNNFFKWLFGMNLTQDDIILIKAFSCDCELNAGACKIKREVRGRGALFTDIDTLKDCPRWVRSWGEAKEKVSEIIKLQENLNDE